MTSIFWAGRQEARLLNFHMEASGLRPGSHKAAEAVVAFGSVAAARADASMVAIAVSNAIAERAGFLDRHQGQAQAELHHDAKEGAGDM